MAGTIQHCEVQWREHWAFFVVVFGAKRIVLLDSMFPSIPSSGALDDITALITLCRGPAPWTDWKVVYPDQVKQLDSSSCGVFMCAISHAFCTGTAYQIPSCGTEQQRFIETTVEEMQERLLTVSFAIGPSPVISISSSNTGRPHILTLFRGGGA